MPERERVAQLLKDLELIGPEKFVQYVVALEDRLEKVLVLAQAGINAAEEAKGVTRDAG